MESGFAKRTGKRTHCICGGGWMATRELQQSVVKSMGRLAWYSAPLQDSDLPEVLRMLKEATWAGHWVSVGSGRVREVSEVLEPPSEELQKLAGAPWWLGFAEGQGPMWWENREMGVSSQNAQH